MRQLAPSIFVLLLACGPASGPNTAADARASADGPTQNGVVAEVDVAGLPVFDGSLPFEASYGMTGTVLGLRTRQHGGCAYAEVRLIPELGLGGRVVAESFEDDEHAEQLLLPMATADKSCPEPPAMRGTEALRVGDRVVLAVRPRPKLDPRGNDPAWARAPRIGVIAPLVELPALMAALPLPRFDDYGEQWLPPRRMAPVGTPASRAGLGSAPRFVVSADQVIDRAQAITWQRKPFPRPLGNLTAAFACEALRLGGHDDWRLPTVVEAQGLLEPGRRSPAFAEGASLIPGPERLFWTRTDDDGAWVADEEDGSVISTHYDDPSPYGEYTVRCVRGHGPPMTESQDRFGRSGGALVDGLAGLAWHVPKEPGTFRHGEAKTFCEAGRFAERDDWRLPTPAETFALMEGCPAEIEAWQAAPGRVEVWTSLLEPDTKVGTVHEPCGLSRSVPLASVFDADGVDPKDPIAAAVCVRDVALAKPSPLLKCPDGAAPVRSKHELRCERDGRPHGPFQTFYPSGAVFESGAQEAGERAGPFALYHEHGGIYARGVYARGSLMGEVVVTRSSGGPLAKLTFQAGRPSGTWAFFDPGGREIEHLTFHDGAPGVGALAAFGETGRKIFDAPTLGGWQHGTSRLFDETTGELVDEASHEAGELHGPFSSRFRGDVHSGQHVRGARAGVWERKRAGKVIERTHYEDGEVSLVEQLDDEGKVIRATRYLRGKRVGRSEQKNERGVVTERVELDDHGTGTVRSYDDEGKLRSEYPFVGGVFHGTVRLLRPDGSVASEESYRGGALHGRSVRYLEDGRIEQLSHYVDGQRHGPSEHYRYDGELQAKGSYVRGVRDGAWTFVDIRGKKTEVQFRDGRAVGGSWAAE